MHIIAIDWAATAAWVQAIGAIIALFVAVGLPRLHERSQRRQLRGLIGNLAEQAIDRVEWLISCARQESSHGDDFSTLSMGEITGLMARLPMDRLDTKTAIIALEFSARCRRITDFWNDRMKAAVDQGIPCTTDTLENFRDELAGLRSSLKS